MASVFALVGAAVAATGPTLPQVVLEQSGHWAVDRTARTVLHVHGGTQRIDASISLPDDAAQNAIMALQGETDGFVVGGDRAWAFDKSELTTAPPVPLPVTDERPVGIETPGGPYLVYRGRGTIVRLGQPAAVVEAGGPVGPPIRTSDGTVWVHRPDNGALCAFRRDAMQLDCGAAAGRTGGLTVLADRAAFVDTATDLVHLVLPGTLDAGAALGTDLPADALLADQGTPTRLPVVVPGANQLRLLDTTGIPDGRSGGAPLDVGLGAGTFSAPMVSGNVVAVLELTGSTLITFDAEGRRLADLRLPPGTDPTDLRRGEDGRIYVDQPDGAGTHVIRSDGTIASLGFGVGGGSGGVVAVAAAEGLRNPISPPLPGQLTVPRLDPGPPAGGAALNPTAGGPGPIGPGSGGTTGGGPIGGGPLGGGPVGGGPVGGGPGGGGPIGTPPALLPPSPPMAVVAQLTGPNQATISWQNGALLTFLWVPFHDRPGSGGQRPPRVRSAMAISASGLW